VAKEKKIRNFGHRKVSGNRNSERKEMGQGEMTSETHEKR